MAEVFTLGVFLVYKYKLIKKKKKQKIKEIINKSDFDWLCLKKKKKEYVRSKVRFDSQS